MVIKLASLIVRVQAILSDLPDNFITDEQIYIDLKTAQVFANSIKSVSFSNEDFEEEALVRLGAYLSYTNYTSLAERQLGTLPQTTDIKMVALRRNALMFLRQMTDFQLDDNLSIDDARMEKSFAVTMQTSPSIFSD